MSKLSVHLVVWNGAKYIPYLFESLRKQTYKNWSLVIIDNNSSDETLNKIKIEIKDFPVEYKIIENRENLGFAGGHNKAFQETRNKKQETNGQIDNKYILLLNQDMYLEQDCLEKMVSFMDEHMDCAALAPRLMKWNFCQMSNSFTNQIDSLGLKVFRNRRAVEWLTGQECVSTNKLINNLTNKHSVEVFGVSGALPMYRKSTLETVKFSNGDFLDSSYHSYKEDVDLAYRLRSAGFKAYVLLDTVAYHDRAGAGPKEMNDKFALQNKKLQSEWVKYHSYKNHLMTLYKNEYWQNLILDFPWILWYELKKFVYFLLFDRKVLVGLKEVWKNRESLISKRQEIKCKRKVNWIEIRQWIKN